MRQSVGESDTEDGAHAACRMPHVPAVLVRGRCSRRLMILHDRPWADEIVEAV
ncbi:hypothetical protein [Streptomyces sp. 2A115]|uniref:hypothetical protein n=1 Tax=Streptomyces sp. 2A115 TaxID=3457439 RepID=UPI003FD15032